MPKGSGTPTSLMSARAGAKQVDIKNMSRTNAIGQIRNVLKLYSKQGLKLADMKPDSKELKKAKADFKKMSASLLKNANKLGNKEFP
jgi:hypothetical protein